MGFKIAEAYVEIGERGFSQTRGRLAQLKNQLNELKSATKLMFTFAGGNLIASGVRSMLDLLASIPKAAVQGAAQFETFTEQWKTLLGTGDKAAAMMERLAKFADTTPFELPETVKAAQHLQLAGKAALNNEHVLRLVGDAAAATGGGFEEISFWVARAYSAMKEGQPFGEAALRLQELMVLTGESRKEIEGMSKLFPGSSKPFEAMMRNFQQFAGAMEARSQTLGGKASTLSDAWARVTREMGEAFAPALKKAQDRLTGMLGTMSQDKGIWAESAKRLDSTIQGILDKLTPERIQAFVDALLQAAKFFVDLLDDALSGRLLERARQFAGAMGEAFRQGMMGQGVAGGASKLLRLLPGGNADLVMGMLGFGGAGGKPFAADGGPQNNARTIYENAVKRANDARALAMGFIGALDPERQAAAKSDATLAWNRQMRAAEAKARAGGFDPFPQVAGLPPGKGAFGAKEFLDQIHMGEKLNKWDTVQQLVHEQMALVKARRHEPPRFVGLTEAAKEVQLAALTPQMDMAARLKEIAGDLKTQTKVTEKALVIWEKLEKAGWLRFD